MNLIDLEQRKGHPPAEGKLGISEVDRQFIAANFFAQGVGHIEAEELIRYEFMEINVRIADSLYRRNG